MDSIEMRVNNLESDLKQVRDMCIKMNDRLIRMEESLKSNNNDIKLFKESRDSIIKLSSNLEIMTIKLDDILSKFNDQEEQLKEHSNRINKIEDKPGLLATKAWLFVVSVVCSSVIGIVIGKFI